MWLLNSLSTFGTFVLELPVLELLHTSFHRLLIVSSFWNHKFCHENEYGRGLKLRNTEGRSDFGLTWPDQLNRPRHRLLPLDRKKTRGPLRRRLKVAFHSLNIFVSPLDFFIKLNDGVTRNSLRLSSYLFRGSPKILCSKVHPKSDLSLEIKQRISCWVADSRGFKALFLH